MNSRFFNEFFNNPKIALLSSHFQHPSRIQHALAKPEPESFNPSYLSRSPGSVLRLSSVLCSSFFNLRFQPWFLGNVRVSRLALWIAQPPHF
ncbi:uncharacterized protein LOC125479822 isoform X2 [Pyrus x bretschneideri]|uniref:uncharacterized protein LOC125479822 isoform X2 n=1 Tax=Pyrus x bretschneideri TaxID=225117 RepID=UPI00202FC39C|nr:uncharacterized protein LOC125479822 isoform X2 [Pyrus x bretschneideri]